MSASHKVNQVRVVCIQCRFYVSVSITIKGKVTKIPIGHRLLWSALIGQQVSVSRHPSKMWSDCFLCSLGEGSVVLWLEQLPWQQKFSGSIPELGSFSTSVALHIVTVVTWKLVDGWRELSWYHHINDGSLMAQSSRTHNRQWIMPESCPCCFGGRNGIRKDQLSQLWHES